jgi:hypothetical protein
MRIESAMFSLIEADLCDGALELFRALNYPVPQEKRVNWDDPRQYVHVNFGNSVLFNQDERNCLTDASAISNLFELGMQDVCSVSRLDDIQIRFLGIELSCSQSARSQVAHSITKILNKGYKQPVFAIFRNAQSIAFSGLTYERDGNEHTGKVYLSEWIDCMSFDESEIDLLTLLSSEYHCTNCMKDYYLDMIHSVARSYYLFKESYMSAMMDYFIRGDYDLAPVEVKFSSASVRQLAGECFAHHQERYGFDFVHEDDHVDMLVLPDEEDWFLSVLDDADYLHDDTRRDLCDELALYEDDGDSDGYNVPEDVPEEYYTDPVRLLEFLERYE